LWAIQPTGREVTDFKKPVSERVKKFLLDKTEMGYKCKEHLWNIIRRGISVGFLKMPHDTRSLANYSIRSTYN
jgi:hypothetical protein